MVLLEIIAKMYAALKNVKRFMFNYLDSLRNITDSSRVQSHQPGHFGNYCVILEPERKEVKLQSLNDSVEKCWILALKLFSRQVSWTGYLAGSCMAR